MDINSFLQSKQFKRILIATGSLAILLAVFSVGIYVGMRKATFSYQWGENYHRMFGGPRDGFLQDFMGRDFIPGNGTVGTVIKTAGSQIIVKGPDGVEKTISTSATTTIQRGRETVKISDIAVDNQIVAIGSPKSDGTIDAKFIRVFDPGQGTPPPPGPMHFPY